MSLNNQYFQNRFHKFKKMNKIILLKLVQMEPNPYPIIAFNQIEVNHFQLNKTNRLKYHKNIKDIPHKVKRSQQNKKNKLDLYMISSINLIYKQMLTNMRLKYIVYWK